MNDKALRNAVLSATPRTMRSSRPLPKRHTTDDEPCWLSFVGDAAAAIALGLLMLAAFVGYVS